MRQLRERKYLALLLALTLLVIAFPILKRTADSRLVLDIIFTVVFLAALLTIFTNHRLRAAAVLLGVPAMIGLWSGHVLPGLAVVTQAVTFHLLAVLFFGFTIGVILRDIYRETSVTSDSVYGAFCGYLLAGLMFGHFFVAVELLAPGSFRGEALASAVSIHDHHFLLTYFSYLTLTTVGYGDIVPASDPTRGLAVIEAIFGQFYIAVLVAELIGRRVSQAVLKRE